MASVGGPQGAKSPNRVDSVVLLMRPGHGRDALADWLAELPACRVTVVGDPDELPSTYDLCLLDADSFGEARQHLERRVNEASPAYLPHVLVGSPDAAGVRDIVDDPLVDDVLWLPVDQDVFRRDVELWLLARRASSQLARREEQYYRLMEVVPDAILLVEDGEIAYANASGVALFGTRNLAELQGRTVDSFVAEEDREVLADLLASIDGTGGGVPELVEATIHPSTGGAVTVLATGVTVTHDGTRATQLVLRDVTSQRRSEEQLELFGRAIESAAQGITIVDARLEDRPLIYVNEGFHRITGYSVDETLGRNCRFLQGRNTDEETVVTIRRALDEGRPVTVDVLNYRKDGTPFWNRLDIVPITNQNGTITHFLGLQRDVTRQKQHEQRLSVMNRVLRHNLRNKLNVIRGYAERIEEGEGSPEQAAGRISAAADELLTISEQVREFDTVLDTGSSTVERLDLARIVEDEAEALRFQDPDARVEVTTLEAADVHAHPTLRTALGHFFGLLGEADSPRCRVEVRRAGGEVVLEVVDLAGVLSRDDLLIATQDVETALEHLQGLELWLLRWAVEHSHGTFAVDVDAPYPTVRLRFSTEEPAEHRGRVERR